MSSKEHDAALMRAVASVLREQLEKISEAFSRHDARLKALEEAMRRLENFNDGH